MLTTALDEISASARAKVEMLHRSPAGYFALSLLAGAYVGFGIVLIFAIGGPLAQASNPLLKALMGGAFGIALVLVVFAGAELFTGNNMVMAISTLTRATSLGDLASVWVVSLVGNLVGGVLIAFLVAQSGVLGKAPQSTLVISTAVAKMHLSLQAAFVRGVLANWLVCLAVWVAARTRSDAAKILLIAWCLFAFVASGFEHSVANMTLLPLALLLPHPATVSMAGLIANLVPVTLGNIVGGALFVGGAYWVAGCRPVAVPARVAVAVAISSDEAPAAAAG